MSDKLKFKLLIGGAVLFTSIVLGIFYVTQHSTSSNIKELEVSDLLNLEGYEEFQKVDFRSASDYNERHIEGFTRRNSHEIESSDQLYESKVLAVGDTNTPWDDIIANLDYLGIDTFHYVSDFSLYQGPSVNLLGACGPGEGCTLTETQEQNPIIQYAIYLGDQLFLNLGGTVESYAGVAIVNGEGEKFDNLKQGQLYRYNTNGVMAMSYPGQMGAHNLTEVNDPVTLDIFSEDSLSTLTNPDFPHDLDIKVIQVDEQLDAEIKYDIEPTTLYILQSASQNRILIEQTALNLLAQGVNIVIKDLYDPATQFDRQPLTVEDAHIFTELAQDDRVNLWDVRNQGYEQGHLPNFTSMTQREIEEWEPTLEQKQQLYVIYCKTGGVTSEVRSLLASKGVHNVVDLGGLAGANVDLVSE